MAALLASPSCAFWQERAEDPAGHSVPELGAQDPDSLVSDSGGARGVGGAVAEEVEGLQQSRGMGRCRPEVPWPGAGAGGRAWSQQSQEGGGGLRGLAREGGVVRWSVGLWVRPSWAAGEVIRQLWPQPRRLCRPPPRPSIRQCLSGPFGGARQTAGPHA